LPRYILTGAPGAGKTSVLRWLDQAGLAVVEEAATDLIALDQAAGFDAPWQDLQFIDRIVSLQRRRQEAVEASVPVVIFDRSPICTLALARFLGRGASEILRQEVARIVDERVYERSVLFVRSLGFIRTTAVRRISLDDALAFEVVHENTYREFGFEFVEVPPGPIAQRGALVLETIRDLTPSQRRGVRPTRGIPPPRHG
jgi:predicted ATPase